MHVTFAIWGRELAVDQKFSDYHQDSDGDWVAQLRCGHFQHVRHRPPWFNRPWVITADGRNGMLGTTLACVKCDEGAPPDELVNCD